jgi:ABC-type lipoprotein release transport system permease subunit
MSAVRLLWAVRLRRSWRAALVLALVVAVGAATALAVAAGARRTSEANEKVLADSNASDLGVAYTDGPEAAEAVLASTPGVERFGQLVGFLGFVPDVPPDAFTGFFATWNDPPEVDRPIVLDGRLPSAANEVFLNEAAAERSGLAVGDPVTMMIADFTFTVVEPRPLEVVGIGLISDEVIEDETAAKPSMMFSAAFARENLAFAVWGNGQVELADDADAEQVAAALAEQGLFLDESRAEDRARVDRALRPLVVTLVGLSLLAGVTTTVIVSQALLRMVRRNRVDERSLAALGCTRGQLVVVDTLTAATVVGVGLVLAVGVAVLVSPAFPVGQVRRITALGGMQADWLTLTAGAAALGVSLVGIVSVASWRARRRTGRDRRVGAAPGWLGARPARSTGIRFATAQRGLGATIAGVAAGLTLVLAAITFTASLDRLLAEPELTGFTWDVMGRDSFSTIDTEAVMGELDGDQDIERVSGLTLIDASIDGIPVPASAWESLKGAGWPPIVDGRAPSAPGEVLMGEASLDTLGAGIGDTLVLQVSTDLAIEGVVADELSRPITVVGTAVSPTIGLAGTDTPRLDHGVLLQQSDLDQLLGVDFGPQALLVELADDADPAAFPERFPEGLPDTLQVPTEWYRSAQPSELSQASSARAVINVGVAALLVVVTATIGHTLLSFVNRRQQTFAVLKTLGFTRRETRETVLWQSLVIVGFAVALAVPVGLALGRWLWQAFADGLGALGDAVLPLGAILVVLTGALLLIEAIAMVPAVWAASTRASRALRAE